MGTKVFKRLESNKTRGSFKDRERTLLIPISLGVSSLCLLHILDQQLQSRRSQGLHVGYNLHILFVDQSTILDQAFRQESREKLEQTYPTHVFTTITLEDCSEYGINYNEPQANIRMDLEEVIHSLPSTTSKVDFIDIIRRRLITAFAGKHNCDCVLFGDSTTRLAERILSETAKGRGNALPWLTADGDSTGIPCVFPLRDLLRKELMSYAEIVSPPLTSLISESSLQSSTVSSKDTTIDGLMKQYFESVEKDYPSIVTNVVRTSDKLVSPQAIKDVKRCLLCRFPILRSTWGGEQESILSQTERTGEGENSQPLCYGCSRTFERD